MKTTTAMIGAALLALTAGAANAQTPVQTPRDRAAPVAQADFVQVRVARLTAMDANGDGQVSVEEMRAAHQARRAERLTTRFARLDTDGDGAISKAEFEAQPAARARNHARAGRGGAHRADRAGSARAGRMMGSESRREMQPVVIADARAKAEQRFAAMDADHDGVVTAAERQASRQAARQTLRQNRMESRAARAAAPAAPAAPSGD